MVADVISATLQMQRKQDLKGFTTEELLQELISREAVKHFGATMKQYCWMLQLRKENQMNRARERPAEVLFLCRNLAN